MQRHAAPYGHVPAEPRHRGRRQAQLRACVAHPVSFPPFVAPAAPAGFSLVLGLLGALDTLCGQAWGAKQYRQLGVQLQKALVTTLLSCIAISALWAHVEPLMLAAGQHEAIAAGAARYLLLSIPALFCAGAFECYKRYLMVQNVVRPVTAVSCAAVACAPLFNWACIFKAGWGLDGAVVATAATWLAMLAMLGAYVAWFERRRRGTPEQTWHGWCVAPRRRPCACAPVPLRPCPALHSCRCRYWACCCRRTRDCLKGLGAYYALAVPSTLMVCLEWWACESSLLRCSWLQLCRGTLHGCPDGARCYGPALWRCHPIPTPPRPPPPLRPHPPQTSSQSSSPAGCPTPRSTWRPWAR